MKKTINLKSKKQQHPKEKSLHTRPKFPSSSIITEADIRKKCTICGSSLKRKHFFKVLGCCQSKCKNFLKNKN